VTRVDPDPRDDQAAARLRDLGRLTELLKPGGTGLPDLTRMDPGPRAELEAILTRLGYMTAETAADREQQKILLGLAQGEAQARELLAKGDYRWRKGKIVRDPQTGQPLRNLTTDRRLRARLRELDRVRTSITGLPAGADDQAPA
jgi:hypothetical protein